MPYAYLQKQSTDASQHAASLYDWNQRYEQLSGGRFSGNFERLQLGAIHVFRETANRTLVQSGHVCTDMVAIGVVGHGGAGGRFGGTELHTGSVFGGTADAEFHFLAGAGLELTAVSIPVADLQRMRCALDGEDATPAAFHNEVLPLPPQAAGQFQALLAQALDVAAKGSVANQPQARHMLRVSLTDAVLQCAPATESKSRGRLAAVNKRRIVAKARAYMQQYSEAVLAMPELCKAIGTSRRALQYAFEDVLQVSPVTYLRLMRLNRVRTDLRALVAPSVGDVAARWGFWHLSRFAAEYKALFGELPSTTLQDARLRA